MCSSFCIHPFFYLFWFQYFMWLHLLASLGVPILLKILIVSLKFLIYILTNLSQFRITLSCFPCSTGNLQLHFPSYPHVLCDIAVIHHYYYCFKQTVYVDQLRKIILPSCISSLNVSVFPDLGVAFCPTISVLQWVWENVVLFSFPSFFL